jgi:hypothetical protein
LTRSFDEFWELMLADLDQGVQQVKNWTAYNEYDVGGDFLVFTLRSMDEGQKRSWRRRLITGTDPNDVIVCTRVRGGKTFAFVSKKEFSDHYHKWPSYKRITTRKSFGETGPYLIALFKKYEHLMQSDAK